MKQLSFLLGLVCMSSFSFSQTMQGSAGVHLYRQSGTIINNYNPGTGQGTLYFPTEVKEIGAVPGFGFYYYHPFFTPSKKFSVGAQTGFDFFAYYQAPTTIQNQYGQTVGSQGGSPLEIGGNLPVLAMARFGCLSSEDASEGIGGALGAGISLFGFSLPNDRGFMIPFTLSAELNYNKWGVRFDLPLKKYQSVYKSYTGDIPRVRTSFYTIQLTYEIGGD